MKKYVFLALLMPLMIPLASFILRQDNKPVLYIIGDSTVRRLHDLARAQTISLPEAARRIVETDELKPATRRALAGLMHDLARWRSIADTMAHGELAQIVLDESGYTAMWQNDKSIEAPGRLENLKELIHAMADELTPARRG